MMPIIYLFIKYLLSIPLKFFTSPSTQNEIDICRAGVNWESFTDNATLGMMSSACARHKVIRPSG